MNKEPDYNHYAYKDDIDITGGVCLLFGIDVINCTYETRKDVVYQRLETRKTFEILSSVQWHAIYKEANFYTRGLIHPYMFIIEALNRQVITVENKFYQALNQRHIAQFGVEITLNQLVHKKIIDDNQPQSTRRLNNLYKLIALMGRGGHGRISLLEPNGFTAELVKEGEECGINLSKDTIRKILEEAEQFLTTEKIAN